MNAAASSEPQARLLELERFRGALDTAADAILLVSRASMCFVDANATACRLLGYTREELFALGPSELSSIPSVSLARVYDELIGGAGGLTETTMLCKDGSGLQVEMQRHAVADGEDWIICCLMRDIGERNQAQLDLHRHTQMLLDEATRQAAILDALPAHIALLDARGAVLSLNASWRRFGGVHAFGMPGDGIGLNYAEICAAVCGDGAHLAHRAADGIRGVLDGSTASFSMEYACIAQQGLFWFLMQVTPLLASQPGGAVVMHIDVTAERAAKQEILRLNANLEKRVNDRTADLEQARADADAASGAKSDFLAVMSHEIRTPMNGVIGMIELLQQTGLAASQLEMVELIRESAFSLLGVIEDILDFSKIEAGRLEIEAAPLALADLAGKICRMLEPLATEQGVRLTLMADPGIPAALLGDAARLRQVLVNLISNAIKFSGGPARRGEVTVQLTRVGAPAEMVTLELRVADNGIGMDSETQDRLFHAFSQGDASTTRRFGGTGLGLVISRRLVDLMGGSLACRSILGHGAEFVVQLALAPAPLPELASGPAVPRQPLPQAHGQAVRDSRLILVAEDNVINQRVILLQLSLLGFAADVAENGLLALDRWRSGRYALLLCDLHMPEMDGYELSAAIRAEQKPGQRMPILALTANTLKGEAQRCRDIGMDDYLSKPLQLADLKSALEKWLPALAPAVVDVGVLEQLIGNDPGVIDEFLLAFGDSLRHLCSQLGSAQRDGQPAQVASYAHQIKSSARSVGAMALGDLSALMEAAGNGGDSAMLMQLMPGFEREAVAVEAWLQARAAAPS